MKTRILGVLCSLLLVSACKKDDAPHNYTSSGPYTSIDDVLASGAPVAKKTTVIVSSGGSVVAQGGTRIVFPSNSFMTATGANVTGSVDVTVNDWLKKGDMIFGKVQSISGSEPLESAGQSFVSVTQNGQPVYMKHGQQMEIRLPQFGKTVPGMSIFLGQAVEGVTNKVAWRATDSFFNGHMVYNGDTISIFSDSMGYCNADRFMSAPNYQTFTVLINSPDGALTGIEGYAFYDNYRAMWGIPMTDGQNNNATHIPDIPVHLVVIGIKDGNFYAGVLGVTPKTGTTYTVTMSKTDPIAFKSQLNAL